jgi:hypothetical protein
LNCPIGLAQKISYDAESVLRVVGSFRRQELHWMRSADLDYRNAVNSCSTQPAWACFLLKLWLQDVDLQFPPAIGNRPTTSSDNLATAVKKGLAYPSRRCPVSPFDRRGAQLGLTEGSRGAY